MKPLDHQAFAEYWADTPGVVGDITQYIDDAVCFSNIILPSVSFADLLEGFMRKYGGRPPLDHVVIATLFNGFIIGRLYESRQRECDELERMCGVAKPVAKPKKRKARRRPNAD